MKEPVHILVTCRKAEMLPAATLVFKTVRVGFPDAPIRVCLNQAYRQEWPYQWEEQIRGAMKAAKPERILTCAIAHDSWISALIEVERNPFWICDADVAFWKEFKHEPDGSALAGVRVPSFFEPWTRTQYRERLHTCLMRIDPLAFRESCLDFKQSFPLEPFKPRIDYVYQQWQPELTEGEIGMKRVVHFYDTLAMAWHAFGGQEFTQAQIESFDHLNCATYADLIAPSLDFDILGAHKAIYENIELARGSWGKQFEWFAAHREA